MRENIFVKLFDVLSKPENNKIQKKKDTNKSLIYISYCGFHLLK